MPQLQPQLDVDARGRLVEDQQPGAVHQRPREDQPALHAARERARAVVLLVREREGVEQLPRALAGALPRHPEVAAVVVERLLERQEPVEVEVLGREPDREARLLVVVDRVVAEHADSPDVGWASPVAQWISVDLPAPFGPEQAEELALLDRERHALQRLGARSDSA